MGNNKYDSIKSKMKSMKGDMLKDILNDKELSKVERLSLIAENNLFEVGDWICHPFEKYTQEYIKKIQATDEFKTKYKGMLNYTPIIDDIFCDGDRYRRGETISLATILEEYTEDKNETDMITIYTNRSVYTLPLQITFKEFTDTLYEWCIENKTVEFKMDW